MKYLLVAIVLLSSPVFAQSEADMEEDAEQIHALKEQVSAIPDFRLQGGVGRRIGENREAYVQAFERMEQLRRLRDQHQAFVASMVQKYAPGQEPWQYARTLNSRFEDLGLGYDVGDDLQMIAERFGWLTEGANNLAMACLQQLEATGTNQTLIRDLHEFYRTAAIREARALLDVCPRMDPGNRRVQRRVERLRPRVTATLEQFEAEERAALAERQWTGNISRLSGGNPRALAAAGLRFLRAHADWGRDDDITVLAVSVTQDWFPAERNLLGQVTKWALGINVAVTNGETPDGVVNVHDLSLITTGPAKNSSFGGVWVGEAWRLLRERVPR